MKPVAQTVTGTQGDCFRACIASILEKPIEDIPLFYGDDDQWAKYWRWLQEQGFTLEWATLDVSDPPPDTFYIASVQSPSLWSQGLYHAVIGYNGKTVWDPHPSRDIHQLGPHIWFEIITPTKKTNE